MGMSTDSDFAQPGSRTELLTGHGLQPAILWAKQGNDIPNDLEQSGCEERRRKNRSRDPSNHDYELLYHEGRHGCHSLHQKRVQPAWLIRRPKTTSPTA